MIARSFSLINFGIVWTTIFRGKRANVLAFLPRFSAPISTHLDRQFRRYLIIHSATPLTVIEKP